MKHSIVLALALLCAAATAAIDDTSVETRHGTVSAAASGGQAAISVRGAALKPIAADSVSLLRIPTTAGREYVLVRLWRRGLNCHHSFVLLDVAADSSSATKEFGACSDLQGTGWSGEEPVIHLKNSGDAGASVASYQRREGTMTLAFESPTLCGAIGFLASKNARGAPEESRVRRVTGSGRLQFLKAPDPACPAPGVFVIPGDSLSTGIGANGYVYAHYTNPRSGRKVEGWVQSARLSD